jgi:hypothetical protein
MMSVIHPLCFARWFYPRIFIWRFPVSEHIKTKRFVKAWLKAVGELQLDHQSFSRSLAKKLLAGSPCALADFESETLKARRLKALVKKRPAVHFNPDHKIDGHAGGTLNKTSTKLSFGEKAVWASSPIEALFYIVLVDGTFQVKSTCAVTGEAVELKVSALGYETFHENLFLSIYHPDVLTGSICHDPQEWSTFVLGDDAAEQYLADEPEQMLLPISQTFQMAREVTKMLYKDI